MNAKKFNLLFAGVFAFILLAGFASATLTFSGVPSSLSSTGSSFSFAVQSNETETVSFSVAPINDGNGHQITFTTPSPVSLADNQQTVTMSYSIDPNFDFNFPKEDFSANLTATGNVSGMIYQSVPFQSSFCEYDNKGDVNVEIRDVHVTSGFGKDNEWYPFDNVAFDARVRNYGSEDLRNVVVEWGLWDTRNNDWAIRVNDENDFSLKNGDTKTLSLSFSLNNNLDENLKDLQDGTYVLYVRATGEIRGGTYEGNNTCDWSSEDNTLNIESDFVILNSFNVPETVQCDTNVPITAKAWNIGDSDQNSVYVKVYNSELGINDKITVGDINSFDYETMNYNLNIPKDADEKVYHLTFSVYDEYDDVYENSDNDPSVFDVPINVSGNCAVAQAGVSAVLQSGGKSGQPMVVKATITNTGDKTTTYLLNLAGYSTWADSATLDQSTITLAAGQSQDVLATLNVNKDASGDNIFNVEVLSENQLVASQPVQVSIESSKFKWPINSGNWHIWAIGALNVLLVIIIIVIAVRIARKK